MKFEFTKVIKKNIHFEVNWLYFHHIDRHKELPKVKKIPGKYAKKWTKFHLKYASKSTYVEGIVWDRTKSASGPFFTDVDGNVLIDFASHVASSPLGYNNPEILNMIHHLKKTDPDRYAGCDFITAYGEDPNNSLIPTPSHLHKKLMEITKMFSFGSAFFTNSGAEAVENAIKICYDHKKNNGYGFNFMGAFHGRTLGALSLNRSKAIQRSYYPQIPKIVTLPYCSCIPIKNEKICNCGWKTISRKGKAQNMLEQHICKEIGIIKPEEVSYIIIEPIQGEGGYRIPNKDFIQEVFETANKHNIPVIADEIQSGLGRTGKWWACEQLKVKPDIITSAKALRIAATIGKSKYFPKENARVSSTWGEGNAIASAVGYKTIEIIQKRNLLENAKKMGDYILKRLKIIEEKYKIVADTRGIGLMVAIEFENKKIRDKIQQKCLKKGLVLLNCGYKTIRILPPLDIHKREIDIAIDILESVL